MIKRCPSCNSPEIKLDTESTLCECCTCSNLWIDESIPDDDDASIAQRQSEIRLLDKLIAACKGTADTN